MPRLEATTLAVGFLAAVLAVALFDARLGLLLFGVGLMAASLDLRRRA